MSTTPIDYAALAKQAGAIDSQPAPSSSPAPSPSPASAVSPEPVSAPVSTPSATPVDYAALAKQSGAIDSQPPPQSFTDRANDTADAVARGFAKGAGDTVSGVSHLLNKIPAVGEILAPSAGISALDQMDVSHGTAEAAGKGLENIAEFAAGDEILGSLSKGTKLVAMAQKYPIVAKTLNLMAAHPWFAKWVTEGGKGAIVGGLEGAVKGAQQGQTIKGAETGAAVGGATGAAIGAVTGAIPVVKNLKMNPFRKTIQSAMATPEAAGEAAAQPIAQAGVRSAAPPVGASLRSGIDVQTPFAEAKALYRTVDDAAKTDFKVLADKMDAAQDAARIAAPGSPEEAVAQRNIKAIQDSIDDHKAIAAKSGVTDVDKTLAQADAKFAETQANKDLNSKLFGSQSVIQGNIAHGVPEKINVNAAINVLENLDKPNKYGISRLQQTSLGKNGAFKLKQYLYDAQKAGQTALNARMLRNTMLKWGIPGITGALGLGYEITK